MARKRYKPEEIVAKLRQVDVLVSQGQNMVDAIRQIGVSEVTYYRWRQEFGGLKTEEVKRLKDLASISRFTPTHCSRVPSLARSGSTRRS
jgi:putative transposase